MKLMIHLRRFFKIKKKTTLMDLYGIAPNLIGDEDPVEYVRKIRDAGDDDLDWTVESDPIPPKKAAVVKGRCAMSGDKPAHNRCIRLKSPRRLLGVVILNKNPHK